jgi:hypothetical protein
MAFRLDEGFESCSTKRMQKATQQRDALVLTDTACSPTPERSPGLAGHTQRAVSARSLSFPRSRSRPRPTRTRWPAARSGVPASTRRRRPWRVTTHASSRRDLRLTGWLHTMAESPFAFSATKRLPGATPAEPFRAATGADALHDAEASGTCITALTTQPTASSPPRHLFLALWLVLSPQRQLRCAPCRQARRTARTLAADRAAARRLPREGRASPNQAPTRRRRRRVATLAGPDASDVAAAFVSHQHRIYSGSHFEIRAWAISLMPPGGCV